MNPKHQHHLSQWGECVYDAQSSNEGRLLGESVLIIIERWTSILKMVEKEECVCGAQSWNERKLLCNPCLSQLKAKLQF